MQAILGAIISSFGFGFANVLIKKSLEDVSIPKTLLTVFTSGSIFLAVYALLTGVSFTATTDVIYTAALMAIFEIVLYLVLYKTFSVSNVTVAVTISGFYPILVSIYSIIFLGAIIGLFDWVFILLMIAGGILISIDWVGVFRDGLDRKDLVKGFWWIMLMVIMHAVYFPLLSEFTFTGNLILKLLIIKIFATIFFGLGLAVYKRFDFKLSLTKVPSLSLLGLLEVIGWVGYTWALEADKTQVGLVTAALNLGIAVTAIGAFFVLKERLKFLQYLGVALVIFLTILQGLTLQ